MKKILKIVFLISCVFNSAVKAQPFVIAGSGTAVYRIQSYADHSPNGSTIYTVRDALNWVSTFNWVEQGVQINTAIIDINFKGSNYQTTPQQSDANTNNLPPSNAPYSNHIVLESSLPLITIPAGKTLIIRADKSYFNGFYPDPHLNNNLVVGGPYSPLRRGFEVTSNSAGSIKFENLKFIDWNLAMMYVAHALFSGTSGWTPPKPSSAGFIKCIRVQAASSLEVRDCEFLGYWVGIEFDNNISNTNIHDNVFETSMTLPRRCYTFPPSQPDFGNNSGVGNPIDYLLWPGLSVQMYQYSQAISLEAMVNYTLSPGPMNVTKIHDNHFNDSQNIIYVESGGAIRINPFGCPVDYSLPYPARANVEITNNVIKNLSVGIVQEGGPCVRTGVGPDNTYQMKIQGNTLQNRLLCLKLGMPYNHFDVSANTFNMDFNTSKFYGYPEAIHLGDHFGWGTNTVSWVFGPNPVINNLNGDNYLGFEMVYDPSNSANSKNLNTFNFTPGTKGINPFITTEGNFGPKGIAFNNLPTPPKTGVLFKNIKFPGTIAVGSGIGVSVKNCTLNSSCDEYNKYPPIVFDPLYYDNLTWQLLPSNGDIPSPIILNAYINNGNTSISVDFNLPGPFFSDARKGPFLIQFYKSNNKTDPNNSTLDNPYGDLTHLLYEATLPTPLQTNPTSLNFAIPTTGVSFTFGDYLAMTVTSLGTHASASDNQTCGTSEPAYFKVVDCPKCLPAFSPKPGKKYVVSAWTRIDGAENAATYDNLSGFFTPIIKVVFYSAYYQQTQLGNPIVFRPSGPIIDGWQRIEGEVTIPTDAKGILVEATHDLPLVPALGNSYFDDIRFYPADGTMKSYVFDPDTKRMMGELDENNYATFYEYDEEGKLVRVKKETEKGIMTIKESRNNKPIR